METATLEQTISTFPAPNEWGIFDPIDCQQIHSGFDCKLHVIEQADGWRASFEVRLPDSGHGNYPSASQPPRASQAEALCEVLEQLIAWLSEEKQRGSKKHQKLAAKMQDWALVRAGIARSEEPNAGGGDPRIEYVGASPTSAALSDVPELSRQDQPTPEQPPSDTPALQTSATPFPEGELKLIPITELYESPSNPRQHYPEKAMAELVESMKQSGFRPWLPLLVRPIGESSEIWRKLGDRGGYEIGAGHRRRRAAELAGIAQVPCIVRPMTDEQFLDVLNFDNSQREDVHPLEEAAGWRSWMEKTGKGVKDIAAKLGVSIEYVYQRLKYAALIPEAQAAFLDGKLTAGHAILIARLSDPKQQQKWLKFSLAADWRGNTPSTRALGEALRRDAYIDLRDNCPFDRADTSLLAGAGVCDPCPKRAANIPGFEFDPEEPAADLCTDRVCHQQKVDNHLYRIRTNIYAEEGNFPVQVSQEWASKVKGAHKPGDWEKAKAGDKNAKTAVVVDGPNVGKVIQVKLKQARPAQSPQEIKAKQERERAAREAADSREKEIRKQILLAVRAKVAGLTRADIEALLAGLLHNHENADELCKLHGISFKAEHLASAALLDELPKLHERELFQLAVEAAVIDELAEWQLNWPPDALLGLAKRYKVDAAAIRKQAEKTARETELPKDAGTSGGQKTPDKADRKKQPLASSSFDKARKVRKRIVDQQKKRWAQFRKKQNTKLAKSARKSG